MKEVFKLYQGTVELWYDEEATSNRYLVTDTERDIKNQPVPGVTKVLGVAIHKPGLLTFPLHAALAHVGATFNDKTGEWSIKQETLLTSRLCNEMGKAWIKKRNAGGDTGTKIHSWVENYLKNPDTIFGLADDIYKPCNAFVKWFKSQDIKLIAAEEVVYSRTYQYAGRYDCLLEIDGKRILCDVKSTNVSRYGIKLKDGTWTGIYPENFLQLGGYSYAMNEESDNKIDDLMVINVTKDGKVHTIRASELGLDVGDCEVNFLRARELVNFVTKTGVVDES